MVHSNEIRKYLLKLVEERAVENDKLPGALQIASELGCSLPYVQAAISSLVQCGVLESIPRSGTYIRSGWRERILTNNLAIYRSGLGFFPEFKRRFEAEFPEIYCSEHFANGNIELKVTYNVLCRQDEYADLSGLFDECFPDKSIFHTGAIDAFYSGRKLIGIPVIFSPGVIFCNPELFSRAGVALPASDWSWQDLLDTVRALRAALPGVKILNTGSGINRWINFVIRCGGGLLAPDASDPVRLDSPESIEGLRRYRELRDILQDEDNDYNSLRNAFINGKSAMFWGFRQANIVFSTPIPHVVTLPQMGGSPENIMGADILVFRRECRDFKLMKQVIRFMLSEKTQSFLGRAYGGIPILKRSAAAVLNPADAADRVFMAELSNISCCYNCSDAMLFRLINSGVERILSLPAADLGRELKSLSETLRNIIKIQQFMGEKDK